MRTLALTLIVVIASCAAPRAETPQAEETSQTNDTRLVLEELRDTRAQIEESTKLHYEAGRVNASEVLEASLDRMQVELRLAKTDAERTKVLEEQLQTARALEQQAEVYFEAGREGEIEMLRARAFRLEAEAQLLADAPR